MLERGALAVILSYPRALPLLGLGCALATVPARAAALAILFAAAGLWLGLEYRDWLINTLISGSATAVRLNLPGPISCLAAGLLLAAPPRLRSWLLPPIASVVAAMLAIAIKLADPSFHDPNFLRGALAAGAWLVAAVALTVHLCYRDWLGIGIRILGSWLIAIGLMLGAAILVPRPTIGAAPPAPADELQRPRSLDMFPEPPGPSRRKSHSVDPGFGPLPQ